MASRISFPPPRSSWVRGTAAVWPLLALLALEARGTSDPEPPSVSLPSENLPEVAIECEKMFREGSDVSVREEEGASGEVVRLGGEGSRVRANLQGSDQVIEVEVHAAGDDEKHDAIYLTVGRDSVRLVLEWGPVAGAGPLTVLVNLQGFKNENIPIAVRAAETGARVDRIVIRRARMTPEDFDRGEAASLALVGGSERFSTQKFLRVKKNGAGGGSKRFPAVFTAVEGALGAEIEDFSPAGMGVKFRNYQGASGDRVASLSGREEGSLRARVNLRTGIYRVSVVGAVFRDREDMSWFTMMVSGTTANFRFESLRLGPSTQSVYLRCWADGDYEVKIQTRYPVILDRLDFIPANLTWDEFDDAMEAWLDLPGDARREDDGYLEASPVKPD